MSNSLPFRAKNNRVADKASPELARSVISEIRQNLDHDPMAPVWAKLRLSQRWALVAMAGMLDESFRLSSWDDFSDSQKRRLRSQIRLFASLSAKIERAAR